MSPIYVRPAREQHEHDRLIRFLQRQLQAKHKKKYEITINPGDEQSTAVRIGSTTLFPDLVLAEGKSLAGIVEVETGESVNNLEAMHQWVPFSKLKVPFHLYVPVPGYDTTKRLMQAYQARVTEIWTYRPANDGFDLVRIHTDPASISAGRSVKAVVVAVAPKPAPPPPPPEPPPPPKPVPDAKAASKSVAKKGATPATTPAAPAKGPAVGTASPAAKNGTKVVATAKPPAAKAPVPAKPSSTLKVASKGAKPAKALKAKAPAKSAPKPAPKSKKTMAKAVSKAAKPVKASKKQATTGKKKGSAGKKGR